MATVCELNGRGHNDVRPTKIPAVQLNQQVGTDGLNRPIRFTYFESEIRISIVTIINDGRVQFLIKGTKNNFCTSK